MATEAEAVPAGWERWSPAAMPHVLGDHEKRVWDETVGGYGPQKMRLSCTVCGDRTEARCDSGRVRTKIAQYAILHIHRDVFAPARA